MPGATASLGALAIFFALLNGTSALPTADADLNSKAWLAQINQYRMMVGLESVEEVAVLSAGEYESRPLSRKTVRG
jgi:hypothetical protein